MEKRRSCRSILPHFKEVESYNDNITAGYATTDYVHTIKAVDVACETAVYRKIPPNNIDSKVLNNWEKYVINREDRGVPLVTLMMIRFEADLR